MKIKYELLHKDAVAPRKAHPLDTGWDLTAVSMVETKYHVEYNIGLIIEPPEGFCTELVARSSISKYDCVLCNGKGEIDASYRGTLRFRFKKVPRTIWQLLGIQKYYLPKVGDRVGQLVVKELHSEVQMEESNVNTDTDRADRGFGSSN